MTECPWCRGTGKAEANSNSSVELRAWIGILTERDKRETQRILDQLSPDQKWLAIRCVQIPGWPEEEIPGLWMAWCQRGNTASLLQIPALNDPSVGGVLWSLLGKASDAPRRHAAAFWLMEGGMPMGEACARVALHHGSW